jgi:hypothetical protein
MGGANPARAVFSAYAAGEKGKADRSAMRMQEHEYQLSAEERERKLKKDVDVFKRQAEVAFGDSVSGFAKAGVDISGSPLLVLGNNKTEYWNQVNEIERTGSMEAAGLRRAASDLANQRRTSRANDTLMIAGSFLSGL